MAEMLCNGTLCNAELINKEKLIEMLANGKMRNIRNCGEKSYLQLCKYFEVKPFKRYSRINGELAAVRQTIAHCQTRIKNLQEKERAILLNNDNQKQTP